MSKKSQRQLSRSKRKKSATSSPTITAQEQPVAQAPEPAARPDVPAPAVRAPVPAPTLAVMRYPYISAEMHRAGILAGVILSVLVVLSLVLP